MVERHYSSTRDVEGYEYDRRKMNIGSGEFARYLDEFHVRDKYDQDRKTESRSGILYDGTMRMQAYYDAYFSAWVQTDGEIPRKEMCYLEIINPVTY